jgi:hydrogenase nickel incorporation protein HypA/HybF
VTVIALRVGALRQVVAGSLELYVELVGRGTVCEGARLEIEHVPALLRCCGEWEAPPFRCPDCGSAGTVVAGEEFEVESIDIEEDACIALT